VLTRFVDNLGSGTLGICRRFGSIGVFCIDAIRTLFTTRLKVKKTFYQMSYIGVGSLSIIFLVGSAVGAVLALQIYIGLERYGATQFVGPIVFIAMAREFGPIFASLMVIGRAGSAMTAELGSMRISEQIDALQTLCINPLQYLIVPRILASTIIVPFLSIFCSFFGIFAGYVTSIYVLNINPETYMEAIRSNVELSDITNGIIKAIAFGFILSVIATYKGYTTKGGAKGLGICTTQSVVFANVSVILADYILSSLMFTK
jgi:phospholipid/cholesterol/gamma-HCH transport system permease protein